MKVRELIEANNLVTAGPHHSLGDACELMKENNVSGLPVLDKEGHLEGLISIGQILHFAHDGTDEPHSVDPEWHSPVRAQPARGVWRTTPVETAMIRDVVTVGADDDIRSAAQKLLDEGVHRAVVLDQNRVPIGMLTSLDFTRYVAGQSRTNPEL